MDRFQLAKGEKPEELGARPELGELYVVACKVAERLVREGTTQLTAARVAQVAQDLLALKPDTLYLMRVVLCPGWERKDNRMAEPSDEKEEDPEEDFFDALRARRDRPNPRQDTVEDEELWDEDTKAIEQPDPRQEMDDFMDEVKRAENPRREETIGDFLNRKSDDDGEPKKSGRDELLDAIFP